MPAPSRAALVLLAALALGACSRPANDARPTADAPGKPVAGGTLTWGVETEPTTLNPHINGQDKTALLLRNAYETLLARDDKGGFLPWLAAAYQVSDDGLTYTFQLRPDVKFSDGSALDAATVIANLEQLRKPGYTIVASHLYYLARIASLQAPDPHTLRIVLKQAYSPFLGYISSIPLLARSAFSKDDLQAGGADIAGTGPFRITAYVPGQELRFARNPDYHWAPANAGHQGPAYLDTLVYRFLPESSVRIGALLSGQVDVIEGVPGQDAAALQANADFSYQRALNPGTPFSLYFNVDKGATAEPAVRQALVDGLDVDTVVATIYHGQRTRAWGITSPIDPLYDAALEHRYGNQATQANALLDAAGWSQRDAAGYRVRQGQRLSIATLDTPALLRDQRDVLLLAIQAQARQRLGIDLRVEQLDIGSYLQRLLAGDYGILSNSNAAPDGRDIENHYLPPDAGGFINFSRTRAPQVLQWLQQAQATNAVEQRRSIYAQLQQFVLGQQYTALPLYQPEDQLVSAKQVHGVGFRPFYRLPENAYDVWRDR